MCSGCCCVVQGLPEGSWCREDLRGQPVASTCRLPWVGGAARACLWGTPQGGATGRASFPGLGADSASIPRRYTLLRIVNVEKRRDSARGSRFLLELEVRERGGSRLRLSEYVFLRLPGARAADADGDPESPGPAPAASALPDGRPELCRPLRLAWRQDVMVHFIVPGVGVLQGPPVWRGGLVGRGACVGLRGGVRQAQ